MKNLQLKCYRIGKDLTLRDVAKLMEVSPTMIGHYENNRRVLTAKHIVALAEIYGVSDQDIIKSIPKK